MFTKVVAAGLALTAAAFLPPAYAADPPPAPAAMTVMPAMAAPDAAAEGRTYFRAHSYDFPTNFRAQHPGPAWILQHASDFNLTPAQTAKMEKLQAGMRGAVAANSAKLKDAYAQYAKDAHEATPAEKTLMKDVQTVGTAQTNLAGAMIPYHLQSYAALDAAQKKAYDRLVAAGL